MKKIFKYGLIIVLVLFVLSLFGGKDKTNPNTAKTENAPKATTSENTALTLSKYKMLVALDADPAGYKKAASEAGINFVHRAPTWNTLETSEGSYDFSDIQTYANLATQNNAKMNLVFRPIDTGNRSMIEPYKSMTFDDPKMAAAIIKMFKAMPQSIKTQVKFLTIGNEIDSYFGSHTGEIEAYATLLRNIIPELRKEFPYAQIAVNTTYGGNSFVKNNMKSITDQTDVHSVTYYHINGDFSVKDPGNIGGVIQDMIKAAGAKKLLIQEIGMPSSSVNGSSEEKQALFVHNVFKTLRKNQTRIAGVTYLWMNDLPQSLVDFFGEYYKLPDNRFKEFLASLGIFTKEGTPKLAWAAFKEEARLTTGR